MRARRRRRRTGPALLIFVLGLGIFLFPILYGAMTDQAMSDNAQGFLDKWGIYETASTEPLPELPEETIPIETTPYAQLLEEMESYNQNLWDTKQTGLKSPSDYEIPSFHLREYGIDNEIFGVIRIPKLAHCWQTNLPFATPVCSAPVGTGLTKAAVWWMRSTAQSIPAA